MELEYAFVAEKADRLQDGRLCIFGAESDTLVAMQFPFTLEFSIVIRLVLLPSESEVGHLLSLDITDQSGKRSAKLVKQVVEVSRNKHDSEEPGGTTVIVQMGLDITGAGCLILHIIVDDRELKRIPIRVIDKTASKEDSTNA